MPDTTRRWYTEPETFIAVAALIVSLSAVVVGVYEASLQRHHDRAEVWPHLEIGTFDSPQGAALIVENTGIGPAVVQYVEIDVDGKPQKDWPAILVAWLGTKPKQFSNRTIFEHGLRAGDQVKLVELLAADLPPKIWDQVARIRVSICYASVFDEYWIVTDDHLGGVTTWTPVGKCPAQPAGTDL